MLRSLVFPLIAAHVLSLVVHSAAIGDPLDYVKLSIGTGERLLLSERGRDRETEEEGSVESQHVTVSEGMPAIVMG
jgi:hypothetical protein